MRGIAPRTGILVALTLATILIAFWSPTVHPQASTVIVVDTTSGVVDGDTATVERLLADRGPDDKISFVEALMAANNTGPGHTIKFAASLPHGAVITRTHFLNTSYTTIDGDTDGDAVPDIVVLGGSDFSASLYVYSSYNIIENIVMENIYIWGGNAHHNTVSNCYIGTDVEGMEANAVVNKGVQIVDGAHHNIIENSIIAGNLNEPYDPDDIMTGIFIRFGDDNEILGNWIGVNKAGEALANDAGILIDSGSERNVIGGERDSTACVYPCNVISGHRGSAIIIDGGGTVSNTVQGNYIGVSPDGSAPMRNGARIGFPAVYLRCGTSQNVIGGERDAVACEGPCNVISGNSGHGVELSATGSRGNTIQGNYIGVSPDGAAAMPNSSGVHLTERPDRHCTLPAVTANNIVGGARPTEECSGPCNVISGNLSRGVLIEGAGATGNVVQGNLIGLDATGVDSVPNGEGVMVGAPENVIGGHRASSGCTGPCNVISGNRYYGVSIYSDAAADNVVQGNLIGLDANGEHPVPNGIGLDLSNASGNTIGGDRPPGPCGGPCNLISGNQGAGVTIVDSTQTLRNAIGNTVRGNEIRANGGLGIDLGADGITHNDLGDGDEGPNGAMNFPVSIAAVYDAAANVTRVYGVVDTLDPSSVTIDVYADDELGPFGVAGARDYLGMTTPEDDGQFSLTVPGQLVYRFLTATATSADGSTSEFGVRPPLVFIPGSAASELVDGYAGDKLWIPPLYPLPVALLRLQRLYPVRSPPNQIYAPDVLQWHILMGPVYGPLLQMLTERGGYRMYERHVDPEQPTKMICDVDSQKDDFPNLFVFPYDWRQSNADNAALLKTYIDCIQMFYPGSQVDILTHSMGGLLARRYILDNPGDHRVGKLITLAAPWLGAGKIIYVLQTGDFLNLHVDVPILNNILKNVARASPAAHELLPGRAYYDFLHGSPLFEEGWDLNGNGQDDDNFDYGTYIQLLDKLYGDENYGTKPGTTGDTFHQGGQDDWTADTSGVRFYHLVGVQSGETAISKVAATQKLTCRFLPVFPPICVSKLTLDVKPYLKRGDGTVPWFSAKRPGYNAPDACQVLFYGPYSGGDAAVEHTALASNPFVHDTIFALLTLGLAPARPAHDASRCTPAQTPVGSAAMSTLATPAQPYNYLTIDGVASIVLSDTIGNSTAPISDTFRASVPGVERYVLGDRIELLVMPAGNLYTATFQTTSQTLAIELTTGTSDTATRAIRYMDLAMPLSVTARLEIGDQRGDVLHYDGDGNGSFESLITASVAISGPLANDLEPPVLEMQLAGSPDAASITLSATDSGSGVRRLYYSLDGTHYQSYTHPLMLDLEETPLLHAFADDNVGNRGLRTFRLEGYFVYLPLVLRN